MLNKKILIITTIILVAVYQLFNCQNINAYPNGQCRYVVKTRDISYCEFDNGDVCYITGESHGGISCNFKNK